MENNNIKILTALLREMAVPVTQTGIREELGKHPNPTSLQAISDLLNNWRVATEIKRVAATELPGIKTPFVAGLAGNKYAVVTRWDEQQGVTYHEAGKGQVTETGKFNRLFTGAVLTAEKKKRSGEPDYAEKQRKETVDRLRNPVFIAGSVLLLLVYLIFHLNYVSYYNLQTVLLLIFKTAGLATTVLLLLQNIDGNNPLVQKFCGSDSNKNCNAILSSDAAKVTDEVSWSEIGFFYFAGTWLVLVFNVGENGLLQALAVINLLALPYTFYSIYYQWRIAKQWCIFCCIVQGLLWLEFFAFLPYLLHGLQQPDPVGWGNLIIGMGIPVLLWLFLKPWLALIVQVNPLKQQLNWYKYNKKLFRNLLESEDKYDLPDDDNTLIFGNAQAKIRLTMVASPSCGHCARMYKVLTRWLAYRNDIKFQIIFSTRGDNATRIIITQLISIYKKEGAPAAKRALNDWYRQGRRNYKAWLKKYPAEKKSPLNDERIEKQNQWCTNVSIISTPAILINGYKLPQLFQADEIKYLL